MKYNRDFLEITGLEPHEITEIFMKSEDESDFIEYLDINECVEQFDLNKRDEMDLKEDVFIEAYKIYDSLKRVTA